ncbi:MAG: hypothetical protein LBR86_07510 [Tannerella sp.]|jgi:hypothetical protein|nr:hypothetical protein [Tannerella sp.]
MSNRRIIPTKDADFHIMQQYLREKANVNITKWVLDQAWMTKVFNPAANLWNAKYSAWRDPLTRTRLITAEKKAARKAYEPHVSMLVKGLRVNPRLTEDERLEIRLTDYDTTPTRVAVPHTWPVGTLMPVGPHQLRLDFRDCESKRRAKPHGVHGCEIRMGVMSTPPASVEDIPSSRFSTRTPVFLDFDMSLRGQTVYVCLRWENTRGEKGPWGYILSAIIP